jgi:hypothetical protein
LATVTTFYYLYAFYDPLLASIQFELSPHSIDSTLADNNHYEQRITYLKYTSPVISNIPIPTTELTIPIPLSWHLFEIAILLLFLFSFTLQTSLLLGYLKLNPTVDALNPFISNLLKKIPPSIHFILTNLRITESLSLTISAVTFTLFFSTKLFLHHHGTLNISNLDTLLLAATSIAMFLSLRPAQTLSMPHHNRREFLKFSSLSLLTALTPFALEKLCQSISVKHFAQPRHRNKHTTLWHKVSISAGLYRHRKNKKIYYVNEHGFIRSLNNMKEDNLIKIHPLALNYSDFHLISKLTSSVFFEDWSLKLLQKGKLLDSLQCLELGCKYEIYRIREQHEQKPNIRLFKLYSGLCHKHEVKHNLSLLKKEITHDKLLSNLLLPPPQQWLMTRAWCFKRRWSTRKLYNKVKLTQV